jgi:hypothetical protein
VRALRARRAARRCGRLAAPDKEGGEARDYNGNAQALADHRATADHDAVQADKGTRTLRGLGNRGRAERAAVCCYALKGSPALKTTPSLPQADKSRP